MEQNSMTYPNSEGVHWGNAPIENDGRFEMPTETVKEMIRAIVRWTRPVFEELHRGDPAMSTTLARIEHDMSIGHRLWLAAELTQTQTPTMAVDNRLTMAFTRLVNGAYLIGADLQLGPELLNIIDNAPMAEEKIIPMSSRSTPSPV
jgi:hypothetical protein